MSPTRSKRRGGPGPAVGQAGLIVRPGMARASIMVTVSTQRLRGPGGLSSMIRGFSALPATADAGVVEWWRSTAAGERSPVWRAR